VTRKARQCPRCLLTEGMPFFQIRGFARALGTLEVPPRGPCTVCQAYDAAFSAKGLADDLAAFEWMMSRVPGEGPAAVVAVSGGKDSLSTLYLAKVVKRWRVAAYLFDNGFIPKDVIAQAQRLCDALSVPLHIDSLRGTRRTAFAREVARVTATGPTPCDTCGRGMNAGLARRCEALGISQVIFGTNFYASWLDRPSALALHPGKRPLHALNLPYALGVTAQQARANVRRLGGTILEQPGVSTNCRVPGLVEARIGRTLGHVPELELLSLEVMVGHLSRREALEVLASRPRPLRSSQRDRVEDLGRLEGEPQTRRASGAGAAMTRTSR
jgi:PP-loop superfamily ATP-utilizing enzyme